MHVADFAADEGFVYFDFTAKQSARKIILHRKTDSLKHEPRAFLRDPKSAMQFVGGNSVLAVQEHPNRRKPFFKSYRRILKNRSRLQGEGRPRMSRVAFPDSLLLKPGDLFSAARRTRDLAVRPAEFNHKLTAILELREVQKCVPESSVFAHQSNMSGSLRKVKYII